ncbi:MAG: LysR family transcriptional regulator, partial [Pseudomonadales bacterium]|nr:LysR family transcriptional regulator [Pseudomonadales bacterium]
MIKLRDLQYLLAIAEHKHFGRAASACFVSQPTLSGQIMKLEQQLGLQLVERHKRGVMLTAAGEQLVGDARKVMSAALEFENNASALRDPLAGERHIGLIPTLAPYLLPHIMEPLNSALPQVEFFLYEEKTGELLADLNNGKLDMLILPWLDEMQEFVRHDLFSEDLVLVTHTTHPLARSGHSTLESLRGLPVLSLKDGHCLRDQALDFCGSAGASEDSRFQATSLETLRYMVASNMGITLLPKLATLQAPASPALAYIPFSEPVPRREIVLLTRPNYTRQESVDIIVQVVRDK